jgi:four helix bundle protein
VGKARSGNLVRRFEELQVWQTARQIAKGVYRATRTQQLAGDPVLKNQMRRAAVSISSNIAEGYERGTRKQHIEFCYTAKGSAGELRSQVILAYDVGLLDATAYEWLRSECERCSSQLARYLQHLQRSQKSIRGTKFAADNRASRPAVGETP